MSIPLRLGPANYWIRDKVLFSAWPRSSLRTGRGETKKRGALILGSARATGSGISHVKNLCLVRVISTSARLFFSTPPPTQPKESGTTGRYQREGKIPNSRLGRNINPSNRKRRRGLTFHRRFHVICFNLPPHLFIYFF